MQTKWWTTTALAIGAVLAGDAVLFSDAALRPGQERSGFLNGSEFASASRQPGEQAIGRHGQTAIAFTENRGQWDQRVLFRARTSGATIWFCREGIDYWFFHRSPGMGTTPPSFPAEIVAGTPVAIRAQPDSIGRVVVHAAFVGANRKAVVVGDAPLPHRSYFFLGRGANQRHADAQDYSNIVYQGIYPGIDIRYEGGDGVLTASLEAAPGADVSQVRFRYDGGVPVSIAPSGELFIEAPWGTIRQAAPLPGPASAPTLHPPGTVVAHDAVPLVPTEPDRTSGNGLAIAYSTYLGGGGGDWAYGVAVDTAGCAVVVGVTYSADFDTTHALWGNMPGTDIFVTKLARTGGALVYSTYLGGNDYDRACAVAVGTDGSAYVTGFTWSTDFPTVQAVQGDAWYADAFVTKLDADGDSLVYSTYLGGSGSDEGRAIAVDTAGSAYVTGSTSSTDFPTVNPYQNHRGATDAFVARLNSSGSALSYCTYLGGSGDDRGFGIAVDTAGSVYVTGYTFSTNFPTANPFQTDQSGGDAFLIKLNTAANVLVYGTYLGGSGDDEGRGVAIDRAGNIFVAGNTFSSDFPSINPYQGDRGTVDAFVTKLGNSGGAPLYSTYLGGSSVDMAYAIAVNAVGNAYVAGYTSSGDFPTRGAVQGDQGGEDAFVTKLRPDGQTLEYSTYLGGSGSDYGQSLALGPDHSVCVAGHTSSPDFPATNPYEGDQPYEDAVIVNMIEPPCACACFGDPVCDSVVANIFDVTGAINVAFRGAPSVTDPNLACPFSATDVDCIAPTTIIDILKIVNVAFRGADPAAEYCNPCEP